MYFHINAAGMVEPCAFVHFATDNIRDKSLKEILASPLFTAYRSGSLSTKSLCSLPHHRRTQALRDIVKETGAQPTHDGAQDVLSGLQATFLDRRSSEWLKAADELEGRYFSQVSEQAGK